MTTIATLITNYEGLTNNYDLITYQDYSKELIDEGKFQIIKLICGHCFQYDHILKSYRITNRASHNYVGKRICPYCRTHGGYLPLIKGHYIKGVHKMRNAKIDKPKCSAKLKSGSFKGKICGCIANEKYFRIKSDPDNLSNKSSKEYFCGRHKKFSIDQNLLE